jgi:hypothetical protein
MHQLIVAILSLYIDGMRLLGSMPSQLKSPLINCVHIHDAALYHGTLVRRSGC